MTDWDAAVASMAGVLGGDLRAALAQVALARERPYFEAEADWVASQAYHAKREPEPEDLIREDLEVLHARVARLMRATILDEGDPGEDRGRGRTA